MNFYEQLGLKTTATNEEIKRSYFSLTRQFTPDKDPETFMRIRKAYEELSDEKKKAAYDTALSNLNNISGDTADAIMEAERLSEKKLNQDAINLLERELKKKDIKNAEAHAIQYALCQQYLDIGKSGKAVDIIERLVRDDPENKNYLTLAVEACQTRGWQKKAYDYALDLQRLDPGNEDNIVLTIKNLEKPPNVLGKMVESIEKHGGTAPMLCAYILSNSLLADNDFADLPEFEQPDLFHDSDPAPQPWTDPHFAAKKMEDHSKNIREDKKLPMTALMEIGILRGMYNSDCYGIFPFVDSTIANIGMEEIHQSPGYKIASTAYAAIEAVRSGIPKMLAGHSAMRCFSTVDVLSDDDIAAYREEALLFELDILLYYNTVKQFFKRFRDEYSALYQYSSDFLEAINRHSENKKIDEINRRIKKTKRSRMRLSLEWLGKDDELEMQYGEIASRQSGEDEEYRYYAEDREPVRVTKIGRNEPCPCGSGLKYKKCCGR